MKKRPERTGIMLAYPVDPGRISRLGDSFLMQPKINGERCIVEWFSGEPIFLSSYGNEFKFLEHLKEPLKKVYEQLGPVPFDGEIYRHGWERERIDSALRRKVNRNPDVEGLEYHLFDIRSGESNLERAEFIFGLRKKGYFAETPVKYVPTIKVKTEDWMDYAALFVELGFEGAILRSKKSPWVSKRNVGMLKFKPTEEDCYQILDVQEAIDKEGHPKAMVGSFLVKSLNVMEAFSVSAGKLPHSKREEYWRLRHLLRGKMLTVKHESNTTSGGIPLCCVAVEVNL